MNLESNSPSERPADEQSDVQQLLANMSLKHPSESLDQRIEALSNRPGPSKRIFGAAWALPAAVAACCLVCAFMGFKAGQAFPLNDVAALPTAEEQDSPIDNHSADTLTNSAGKIAKSVDQKSAAANDELKIIDAGLFLLDGKVPVRKYIAVKQKQIQITDPKSGKPVLVNVPFRTSFVTPSHGT